MDKTMVALFFAALTAVGATARAGIGAFAGWWDARDCGDMYGGGVKIAVGLPAGLRVEVRGSFLKSRDREEADVRLVPLEALAGLQLGNGALRPYIGAGVGWYLKDFAWKGRWKQWEKEFDGKDCAGYFALAGLAVPLGPVTLFGEAKYTLVGKDDKLEWRGRDIEEKYSFDGLSVNAGLEIGF